MCDVLYVAGWEPIDFKMPLNGACRCSKNSEFQNLKNSLFYNLISAENANKIFARDRARMEIHGKKKLKN